MKEVWRRLAYARAQRTHMPHQTSLAVASSPHRCEGAPLQSTCTQHDGSTCKAVCMPPHVRIDVLPKMSDKVTLLYFLSLSKAAATWCTRPAARALNCAADLCQRCVARPYRLRIAQCRMRVGCHKWRAQLSLTAERPSSFSIDQTRSTDNRPTFASQSFTP